MSGWTPSLDIPILVPIVAPTALAVTAATLVLTAPSPTLPVAVQPSPAVVQISAPDPVVTGVLALDVATIGLTAPDPERVGSDVLTAPTADIVLTAPDPTLISPWALVVSSARVNLGAPDPEVAYGYVTNEDPAEHPTVAQASSRGEEHRRQIATVLNLAMSGKLGNTGVMTLLPDVPATFLRDSRLGPRSKLELDPMTAAAAAEKAAGTIYVLAADRREGQWLITHANDPADDRTFRYSIVG